MGTPIAIDSVCLSGAVRKFISLAYLWILCPTEAELRADEGTCQRALQLTHEAQLTRQVKEWASQHARGLPEFSARPESVPITNLAFALGRLHLGNEEMLESIKRREQEILTRYERAQRLRILSVDELMMIGVESQFYRELREVISGEALPVPGQTAEQVEAFARSGVSLQWAIREAERRAELFQMGALGKDRLEAQRAAQFYQSLMTTLSQRQNDARQAGN